MAVRCNQTKRDVFLKQPGATLAGLHTAHWRMHVCMTSIFLSGQHVVEGAFCFDIALLDPEKRRRPFSASRAVQRDFVQLRRHSSLSTADWKSLVYGYQAIFGKLIRGLQP
ncbi:lipopolysaccharide kinase InaA family protein [Pseudomonas duriflava]|uniref:lipopolysaccharide kinase InaA family protein n=1 Tax=Pseudomonas duriflava TaxID=459528 RepID=UPI0011A64231|nr:lipopolysaccharide kinase InaA family protein [Pseudomonas duriflava]